MARTLKTRIRCFACDKEYAESNYYSSNSIFFSVFGRVPYCKHCIDKLFQQLCDMYKNEGISDPIRVAVKRLCAAFDIFYSDKIYDSAMNQTQVKNISIFSAYMKLMQLQQHKGKDYSTTLLNEEKEKFVANVSDIDIAYMDIDEKDVNFFGNGFTEEDYRFLRKEYDDWTARHECKTKAQEEVFKDICFNRLQNLKALRKGEETKDITAAFQKLLDSGKLQPKQNAGDTTADNQTFGTLIDKWENTRPLPEIDDELKDVDKIGYYIDTFYKGHICKMLNVKNAFSNLYSSMMEKFTVSKPEYNLDEDNYDSEINFDTIFGNANTND